MKTLKIRIDCGDMTCAREPGLACEYIGSRQFGTVYLCSLFPSSLKAYTDLEHKDGWLQRCAACLEAEEKGVPDGIPER